MRLDGTDQRTADAVPAGCFDHSNIPEPRVVVPPTLGLPFGVALVASTTFGAFKLERDDVWVGWVMPAYIAIAAILVGGQFADGAPGFSIVGQVLLVGTTLITIAPWLAIATVIGVLLPRVRKR